MTGYQIPNGHEVQLQSLKTVSADGHAVALRYTPPILVCAVGDLVTDYSVTKDRAADTFALLLSLTAAKADLLVRLPLPVEQFISDYAATLAALKSVRAQDSARLSRAVEQAVDAAAVLDILQEVQAEIESDLRVAKVATAQSFARLRSLVDQNLADALAATLKIVNVAAGDEGINLQVNKQTAVDALSQAVTWVSAFASVITILPWPKDDKIADVLADLSANVSTIASLSALLRWAVESDADVLAETLISTVSVSDLVLDLSASISTFADGIIDAMRALSAVADTLAASPVWKTSWIAQTIEELQLYRPRQIIIPATGGSGHKLSLTARYDRVTGEPIVSAEGHDIPLKARTAWKGEEFGWDGNVNVDFAIPASAWWKMASAQVLAALPWKIIDVGLSDIASILAHRRAFVGQWITGLSLRKEDRYDLLAKLGIRLTDEQWEAVRQKVEIVFRTCGINTCKHETSVDALTMYAILEIARREVEADILQREVE